MANCTPYRRALGISVIVFCVMFAIYSYACYASGHNDCACIMQWGTSCDCRNIVCPEYKWIRALGAAGCAFICSMPRFKYSRLIKTIAYCVLVIYALYIVRFINYIVYAL